MIRKTWYLTIMIILVAVLGVSFQPIKAQIGTGSKVNLPVIVNSWPFIPTFGAEVSGGGQLQQAADADVYWLRYNALDWTTVQPNNSSEFLWSNVAGLESVLKSAHARGAQVILIVRGTPPWAQMPYPKDKECGPIKQSELSAYANFLKEMVKRYSVEPYGVKYYELYNEPDIDPALKAGNDLFFGCWGDSNDPYYGGGYYAEMLKAAYPAIKSTDPSASVLIGGLLLDCDPRQPGTQGYCGVGKEVPPKFFEGILRNGGASYFDYVSFHGYPTYSSSFNPIYSEHVFYSWRANGGVVEGKIDYLKSVMAAYGVNKPIFHTEGALLLPAGASTTPEFEQSKADYAVWLYARNWAEGIKGTIWYTLNGPGWRNSSLLSSSQSALPAYNAYKFMTQELSGAAYRKPISLENGVFGFEFKKGATLVWVVFSPGQNPTDARVISVPANFTAAYDQFGNPITPSGSMTILHPTYIELK